MLALPWMDRQSEQSKSKRGIWEVPVCLTLANIQGAFFFDFLISSKFCLVSLSIRPVIFY